MSLPPLLDEHIASLRGAGHKIEVLEDGPKVCVVLQAYRIPYSHWNRSATDLMVICQAVYPNAKIDMFYVTPGLRLASGGMPKSGDTEESHAGRSWQRFSWHVNSWNPAHDSLISYLDVVKDRLSRKE